MSDVHGNPCQRFASFAALDKITKDDIVIILGDFGIPFGINHPYYKPEHDLGQARWLNNQGWTTIAICGNHDDRSAIAEMPDISVVPLGCGDYLPGKNLAINGEVFENIIIIDKPCIANILDNDILFIPGAASHDVDVVDGWGIYDPDHYDTYETLADAIAADKQNPTWHFHTMTARIKGWSWWENEDVDIPALKKVVDSLPHNSIKYIMSHDAPAAILKEIGHSGFYTVWRERNFMMNETKLYLSWLYNYLDFDHWFTGHYHEDKDWTDHCSTLYHDILVVNERI